MPVKSVSEFTHEDGKVTVTVVAEDGTIGTATYDPYYSSEREDAHRKATAEALKWE